MYSLRLEFFYFQSSQYGGMFKPGIGCCGVIAARAFIFQIHKFSRYFLALKRDYLFTHLYALWPFLGWFSFGVSIGSEVFLRLFFCCCIFGWFRRGGTGIMVIALANGYLLIFILCLPCCLLFYFNGYPG